MPSVVGKMTKGAVFPGVVGAEDVSGNNEGDGFLSSDCVNDVDNLNAINTLNLPMYASHPDMSANPSGSAEGDIYFNSTDKNIYRFDGTEWLATSASVISEHNLSNASSGSAGNSWHSI